MNFAIFDNDKNIYWSDMFLLKYRQYIQPLNRVTDWYTTNKLINNFIDQNYHSAQEQWKYIHIE